MKPILHNSMMKIYLNVNDYCSANVCILVITPNLRKRLENISLMMTVIMPVMILTIPYNNHNALNSKHIIRTLDPSLVAEVSNDLMKMVQGKNQEVCVEQ